MASNTSSDIRTGLLIVGGLVLINKLGGLLPGEGDGTGHEDLPDGQDLDEEPTYPQGTFVVWANALATALVYMDWEDEETVYRIFGYLHNVADVLALEKAFGSRCATFGVIDCYTLSEAIVNYFNAEEVATLNGILSAKGINFSY